MRTLPRATLLLLTLVSVQTTVLAEGPTWRDSTRDVYVDGHLDRTARVLSADSGEKTAVLLVGERKALPTPAASSSRCSVGGMEYVLTSLELAPKG